MSQNVGPRRIILDLAVTLDGVIEGNNGEVDWCIMDSEMFIGKKNTCFRVFQNAKMDRK
jgi:dihydrofolate reductase